MTSPRRLTLPILLTGTFMGFLDLWLVIVAVPSIAADLHASVATSQLVLSMYVVAYGATLVIGGRLGDRYGRRRVFTAGMLAFTLASAGAAAAPSISVLIVVRVLQGAGGAAMLPQVLATVQAIFTGESRRRAILAYTTVIGAAAAFGQVIGGGLIALDVAHLTWRVLFLINLPIGAVTLALIPRALPETSAPEPAPIDGRGAAVLAVALGLLLLGLGLGPGDGWPLSCGGLIAAGLAGGLLLVPIERRHPTPLLPTALLRQPSVRWGLAATLGFYAANNIIFVGLTLFLQEGLGFSALDSGLAYLPLGLSFLLATLAGRRPQAPSGARALTLGSLTVGVGLAGAIAASLLGAGPVAIALVLLVAGAGLGLSYPAIVATVMARVRPGEEGAATGVLLTATQMSNALGIAAVTALWTALSGTGSRDRLGLALAIAALLSLAVAAIGRVLRRPAVAEAAPEASAARAVIPPRAPAGSGPAPTA